MIDLLVGASLIIPLTMAGILTGAKMICGKGRTKKILEESSRLYTQITDDTKYHGGSEIFVPQQLERNIVDDLDKCNNANKFVLLWCFSVLVGGFLLYGLAWYFAPDSIQTSRGPYKLYKENVYLLDEQNLGHQLDIITEKKDKKMKAMALTFLKNIYASSDKVNIFQILIMVLIALGSVYPFLWEKRLRNRARYYYVFTTSSIAYSRI